MTNEKKIKEIELIDKAALVAEIERQQRKLCVLSLSNNVELRRDAALQNGVYCSLLSFIDTLEVKEVDFENYNKIKQLLSLSFMNFLDDNRYEGKMCLSNGECFDIDKAFNELDFAKLFRYIEKYLKAQKGE